MQCPGCGADAARGDRGERSAPPAMTPLHSHCLDLDLHRLDLRFAASRLLEPHAVARLAESIERCGQIVPCIVVAVPGDEGGGAAALVLIDGYRRVAALRRLGRDTAGVEQWSCDLTQALLGVLARAQDRPFASIEQALLLRELVQGQGLSQHDVARRCGPRRELGQPAPAIAVRIAGCGAGGGARWQAVELGRQPGGGAVGARQRRACRAPADGAGWDTADDAGVALLVRALPTDPADRPRAHGRPPAPVHRHVAGEHRVARRRAPARRPQRRMPRRSEPP